jgi:glycosyltransferase involved in cell wall biosynthesis
MRLRTLLTSPRNKTREALPPDVAGAAQARKRPRLRLAFIGMRGLPADLPGAGGGERETEAKATRLAERGHQVTVYCRWHYNRRPQSPWRGLWLVSLPSLHTKNLDTISHSLLAALHVLLRDSADIVSLHGMGNALFAPLLRLGGKRVVVYMDGIDWERPKWGRLARLTLQAAAWMAFRFADAVYVDNQASQSGFKTLFSRAPQVITLAADVWPAPGSDLLAGYGLQPNDYILFVGLLRPDKGVHLLVEAYAGLETEVPLVIVGDDPDHGAYAEQLKRAAGGRVHFLGYAYGQAARQLFANCLVYVQPSLMEGNSPALMSAMACGRCVLASDIEQNRETVGEAGLTFRSQDAADLRRALAGVLSAPERVQQLGRAALERINTTYNWNRVIDQLEALYERLDRRWPAA